MKSLYATAVATLWATTLYGQALTSRSGTITDPSHAVVPGVSITITSTTTQAARSDTSDASGRYSFLQVQPGTYKLEAKFHGFETLVIPEVRLLVNTPATLPLTFQALGSI